MICLFLNINKIYKNNILFIKYYFSIIVKQCGLEMSFWTGFNHFVIWGSIVFYYAYTFPFYADFFDYTYSGTAVNVMGTANYWFTVLLTVSILLIPILTERFYYIDTRPTLTDKVRMKQKIGQLKSRSGARIVRRASTTRRSQRSVGRSGYAFAHQEGFGKLIMDGSMVKKPPSANSTSGKKALASQLQQLSSVEVASQLQQLASVQAQIADDSTLSTHVPPAPYAGASISANRDEEKDPVMNLFPSSTDVIGATEDGYNP